MTVLVTGASGFIGSRFVAELAAGGWPVRAVLRRPSALPAGVEPTIATLDGTTDWSTALRGIDAIVHLAARVHVIREAARDPLAEFRRVNVTGTLTLAEQAAAAGVRRFVFVSSIKVNGESGVFVETDPAAPADAYAISKMEAEQGLQRLGASGLEVVVVRPPLVYGAGVGANFAALMRAIAAGVPLPLASVHNRRSLLAVDNLVDFLMTCLLQQRAAGETFFASDGEDLSTPELVRRLARAMGRPARLVPVPPAIVRRAAELCGQRAAADRLLGSLQVDIGKARSLLAWRPPVSVDEALARTCAGYR